MFVFDMKNSQNMWITLRILYAHVLAGTHEGTTNIHVVQDTSSRLVDGYKKTGVSASITFFQDTF